MIAFDTTALVAHILPVRQRDFQMPVFRPRQPRQLRLAGRKDDRTAAIIEEGLDHALYRGRDAAINYLCEQGIALRIISRVLFQPQLRRSA
ncbi:hypothetical protein [Duganella sp. P38]|uniref:hypothetical protein n=1 Tax=Duganella sp. P38 TaxID=3423949 RepID=UPI003D7A0332